MQDEVKSADWPAPSTGPEKEFFPATGNPYDQSLFGEYARLLVLLFALPLLVRFAYSVVNHQTGISYLVAVIALLASIVTSLGHRAFLVCLLSVMVLNVFAAVINPSVINRHHNDLSLVAAAYVLLFCLATSCLVEISVLVKRSTRTMIVKTLVWGGLAIPMLVYAVGIPIFNEVWNVIKADERTLALDDPNWNLANEIAFRGAKFSVFAVFTYFGACLGSFLNVVAWCVPRGEGIGIRSSCCPQCGKTIGRIDNLPIFSYLNLGARCRHCRKTIPIRYLIVELVAAAIFGSLFLYQLVTGCRNVPELFIHHRGILWVILYPKWPAIAAYFFHAFFMSAILVLVLIEWDKQPLKRTFMILIGLVIFVCAVIYPPLQPVPLFAHVPNLSITFSPLVEQAVKTVIGGFVGVVIGRILALVCSSSHPSILTSAFGLAGMVLGWQALVHLTIVFGVLMAASQLASKFTALLRGCPTTVLLIAIMLHHPFWRIISKWW